MKTKLLTLISASCLLMACSRNKEQEIVPETNFKSAVAVTSAVTVNVTKDETNVDIPVDATGYNTKFPDEAEPWNLSNKYTPAFVTSQASIMRYPGGTVANYWDFDNDKLFTKKGTNPPAGGWVVATTANIPESVAYNVISTGTQQVNTVQDLSNVVSQSGCSVVFVMNMTTPGWDYYKDINPGWSAPVAGDLTTGSTWKKMLDDRYARFKRMLTRATTNGIPIKYIELGNELYFFSNYYEQAFPNGNDYATAANYIAGKLKADYPNLTSLKISAVASAESTKPTNSRVTNWNSQAVTNFDRTKVHSVSMHSYYNAAQLNVTNESTFHESLLGWIDSAKYFVNINQTQTKVYDQNWRVWYTEVYANDEQDKTWANVLTNLFSGFYFYQYGNSFIYLQSRFDQQVDAGSQLKPRAAGFIPFMQAAKFATKTNRLIFDGGGTIGGSIRKVLQGYVFEKPDGTKKVALINLSETSKTVNLSAANLFGSGTVTLSGKKNVLTDTDVPDNISDTSYASNAITIEPYSINFIR